MSRKKGMIDEWQEAALKVADQLGIIDHDFTLDDLEPIKKALKAAYDKGKEPETTSE